jgi:hypothetical protein
MTDADKVGYGLPPKRNQFKKGQSGNPLGSSLKVRKRKRRHTLSLDDLVLESSQELLRIREGNRTSSITIQEALVKKQTAMALNGNRLAMKNCLDRIHEAQRNKLAKVLETYETFRDYRDNYPARVKSHRNRGLPPPLPHPDDMLFDRRTGDLTLTGPSDPEELATLKKVLEALEYFKTLLDEHRLDAEEAARQGYPYLPSDFTTISLIEKHLRSFDYELERRGWLPRVAGEKEIGKPER